MIRNEQVHLLLAAASAASAATNDLVEACRDDSISATSNVGAGETLTALADAMRLLLDATSDETEGENQLHGAVIRFLDPPFI